MGDQDLFVILHNVRSCYNVGSVFRTSDAFGVKKIFLGGYTPNPAKNKSISKTALGAQKFVPWEAVWHTHKLIERLQKAGVGVFALEQSDKSVSLEEFMPMFPMALLLGNEVNGLSERILVRVDGILEIPMLGEKESLNVSVAFGVSAYAIVTVNR